MCIASSLRRGFLKSLFDYIRSLFLLGNPTEDYDEERAVAHVRRVLDVVACTTSFGPCGAKFDAGKNVPDGKSAKKTTAKNENDKQSQPPPSQQSKNSKSSNDVTVDGDGEMSHSFPKLSSFYEFFSLSHLAPPLQCIFHSPLHLFVKIIFKFLYL